MVVPVAFIYLKWCDPDLSAFLLTCCLLFLLFFFVFILFLFFANKVELTKADLQGREGSFSPLLVWTERCFYVTFDTFYWMQSHLWDRNRTPGLLERISGLKTDLADNGGVFVDLGGFDCINLWISVRAQVDFLKCLIIVQANSCCVWRHRRSSELYKTKSWLGFFSTDLKEWDQEVKAGFLT